MFKIIILSLFIGMIIAEKCIYDQNTYDPLTGNYSLYIALLF